MTVYEDLQANYQGDGRKSEARLRPVVKIDAASSGLARSVDRKHGLDALALAADGEGVEELVPSLRSFLEVGSVGSGLQPRVELNRHGREKLPPVHSIAKMFTEHAAARVFGWLLGVA